MECEKEGEAHIKLSLATGVILNGCSWLFQVYAAWALLQEGAWAPQIR